MNYPSLIGGRYRVERLLGQGGVAEIYLATDTLFGLRSALKVAHKGDTVAADAIKQEFAFAMIHRHPSLVNPTELIFDGESPVIVMPYISDLSPVTFQGLADQVVESVLSEMLETAAFIHFSGYLYNDFKPANYLFQKCVDNSGNEGIRPLLLDFNLVSKQTESFSRRGTIEYTSPEILSGQSPRPPSDIYSLGATIYELFSGRAPFIADESPALIKMITEGESPDFSSIPRRFRVGLEAMLSRAISARPMNARDAAVALGVEEPFLEHFRSRSGYYFSAGNPPFAGNISKAVREHIAGKSERMFLIPQYSKQRNELFYLALEFALVGWNVKYLDHSIEEETAAEFLNGLSSNCKGNPHSILFIDDISHLSQSIKLKIRALLRCPRNLPIVAVGRRWSQCDLPHVLFDPSKNMNSGAAAKEVLSSFLKRNEFIINLDALGKASGGDPELLFLYLTHAAEAGEFDPLKSEITLPAPDYNAAPENVAERMIRSLDDRQSELLSILSVWRDSVPLMLLSEFPSGQRALIDPLISCGCLKLEKDSIAFSADWLRQAVYSRIPVEERERLHALWADLAGRVLIGSDNLTDLLAWHWGLSNDHTLGYEANLKAARDYFKKSDLISAKKFAEALPDLAGKGGGPLSEALMIYADVLKQEGDYPQARARYLELLRHLDFNPDSVQKAETLKDLGDLYRSLKNPRKALLYTQKALAQFEILGNDQGVANCHNNIGLIFWVSQEYEKALDSFAAAHLINERLANFQELAKIQSNIGIIKDILGRTGEVGGHFEQALSNAHKASDPWLEALLANNLGYFLVRQNELQKARVNFEQALEISERIGYTETTINALSNLGLLHLQGGALFLSIDYSQKAMQMAEELGNRQLSLDAQMYLAEVSILMGNFLLADNVLGGIEGDKVYHENKVLAGQVDLRRSWLCKATGDFEKCRQLAARVTALADSMGDLRLKLESELTQHSLGNVPKDIEMLSRISERARELGHIDLQDGANLVLARALLSQGEEAAAEALLGNLLDRQGQTFKMALEAKMLLGESLAGRGVYDRAIEILTEMETLSAGSGFIPKALEAATGLSEVYLICGKAGRCSESLRRADTYSQRILASLPASVSVQRFSEACAMRRFLKVKSQFADINNAII